MHPDLEIVFCARDFFFCDSVLVISFRKEVKLLQTTDQKTYFCNKK